jgi:L-ribulose-5-phosphate 4-epimerase
MSVEDKARESVMWGVETLCGRNYVCATGGNISCMIEGENRFVITPSSRDYDTMTKDDLCVIDMEGKMVVGQYKPSVETHMHRLIYVKRQDVKCVIHMHSKFATAAASMEGMTGIPAFNFEMFAYFGGSIPLVPFAMGGTMELAELVQKTFGDSMGVIMANHGAIGVGPTMKDAITKCDIIERAAESYLMIKAAGEVKPLPPEVLNMKKTG